MAKQKTRRYKNACVRLNVIDGAAGVAIGMRAMGLALALPYRASDAHVQTFPFRRAWAAAAWAAFMAAARSGRCARLRALGRQHALGHAIFDEHGPAAELADDVHAAHHAGLGEFHQRGVVDAGGGHGDLRGGAVQAIRG
jgi:hypothetical protein